MDMEFNHSTIKIHIKDNIAREDFMEKGNIFGPLVIYIKGNSMKAVSTAKEYGLLSLEKPMKVAINLIKKVEVVNTDGETVVFSKDNFKVIKSNYNFIQKR